jgi:23S rRNA (adenine-N6)-dimethyltransferase
VSYRKHKHSNRYSQNELINKETIRDLVQQSSIKKGDLVYDIGAGSGNITEALLAKGARVIAIENDERLYLKCRQRFLDRETAAIHHADFLQWEFSPGHRYKVFSNIPFIQTADIIKKLAFNDNPPDDCYLMMQKEAAEKYTGVPKETLVSLLIKPRFWVDIIYRFKRRDFYPVPSVDIVLMQLEKRMCRLVPDEYYGMYRDFIVFCREGANRTIKSALLNIFSREQLKQIAARLGIDLRQRPLDVNFQQYLGIFQCYLSGQFQNIAFLGAEARLMQEKAKIIKVHRTKKR